MFSYLMFISLVRNRNHTEGAMAIAPPRNKNIPATRWQPALLTRNLMVLMSGSGLPEQQQVLHIPAMHSSKAREPNSRPIGRQNCSSRRSSWSTLEYHCKQEKTWLLLEQFRTEKQKANSEESTFLKVIPLNHSSNILNSHPVSHI